MAAAGPRLAEAQAMRKAQATALAGLEDKKQARASRAAHTQTCPATRSASAQH
jgi:hypothetical protein